jgi:hypothetical protein
MKYCEECSEEKIRELLSELNELLIAVKMKHNELGKLYRLPIFYFSNLSIAASSAISGIKWVKDELRKTK